MKLVLPVYLIISTIFFQIKVISQSRHKISGFFHNIVQLKFQLIINTIKDCRLNFETEFRDWQTSTQNCSRFSKENETNLSKVSAGIFSVIMERATNTRNRREREEKKKVKENLFQHRENRLERERVYVNIGGRERRTEKIDRETRKREKSVKGWNH
jgi:hypothetical protein